VVSTTSTWPQLRQVRQHLVHVEVGADPGKADLPALLGDPLRFEQVRAHLFRLVPVVEVPDVEVIGPQFAQGRVQVGKGFRLGPGHALAREDHLLTDVLEGCADHSFVVAVLIDAGGVEVVDSEVRRALDHGRVCSRHAAERERCDLQAGLAQRAVGQLDGFRTRLAALRRERQVVAGAKAGRWKHQACRQKVAT